MNPKVDWYFAKAETWQEELKLLRSLVLDCQLVEELKWGVPTYTYKERNIALIHTFKDYCALLFVKGALLKDSGRHLIQQTENVQSARQLRFTSVADIVAMQPVIADYVFEACEVEELGLKVALKQVADYAVPAEFQKKLDEVPGLTDAFNALTPGRQKAYLYYFGQPKQAKTRTARVEKYMEQMLAGKGLDDE